MPEEKDLAKRIEEFREEFTTKFRENQPIVMFDVPEKEIVEGPVTDPHRAKALRAFRETDDGMVVHRRIGPLDEEPSEKGGNSESRP